jgi:uncharacterized membrane-anchored protein YitT (DUF2179 family)
MKQVKHLGITVAVIISLFLIFSQTVYAAIDVDILEQAAYPYYIDPGTGSIIIQVLIGAVVAGAGLIGVYRMRVKNFLSNLFKKRQGDEESE